MSGLGERLRALAPAQLTGIRRGIEKESLRVWPDGTLATTPHPPGLGSALTHPHITTDFSESQLELITGVHTGVQACLAELTQIHQVVYREIGDEVLWCASMPCKLPADGAIPIGRYGNSNVGRAKSVYRTGLVHRYGARMQTISGIHYNFSMPNGRWPKLLGYSDINTAYFALIRNFRRHAWLLFYLFGASPAVCATFVDGQGHGLRELAPGTLYLPHATSLRMGRLGYQSDAQSSLAVSYNNLDSYAASLEDALTRPYPPYEAIGIRDGDNYRQLAASLIQIENEFYGKIRPKRRIRQGERPLHALRERGVEYVEVRLMDLDPFCPIGITAATIRLLDVLLLHCLLSDSPEDTPQEIAAIGRNQERVAARGREPGLRLERGGQEVELSEWGSQVLAECELIAAALDAAAVDAPGASAYREGLSSAVAALAAPGSLPSARILDEMQARHGGSHLRFVLAHSLEHRSRLQALSLDAEVAARFARLAEESIAKQRQIEAGDTMPFEIYRQKYLAPVRLNVPPRRSTAN